MTVLRCPLARNRGLYSGGSLSRDTLPIQNQLLFVSRITPVPEYKMWSRQDILLAVSIRRFHSPSAICFLSYGAFLDEL